MISCEFITYMHHNIYHTFFLEKEEHLGTNDTYHIEVPL